MNKYGNKKITVDGMTFDSKKEYWRWCELKLLEKAGAITGLERQHRFMLVPRQKDINGKILEREICYIADFVYTDKQTGETVVEDTKGVRTKEYIIKRKLMLWFNGIRIKEV